MMRFRSDQGFWPQLSGFAVTGVIAAILSASSPSGAVTDDQANPPQVENSAKPQAASGPWVVSSGRENIQDLSLTVYNGDTSLVRETRRLTLPKGRGRLDLLDVSGQLRAETAIFGFEKTRSPLTVIEQNFDFELITYQNLLKAAVGSEVLLVKTHPTTGETAVEPAQLLAYVDQPIVQSGNQVLQIDRRDPSLSIRFRDVPANLRARPTLSLEIEGDGQDGEATLQYLSSGLSWTADYVARLNPAQTEMMLQGWTTIENQSGTAFENALLQLVAGDVNIVRKSLAPRRTMNLVSRRVQEQAEVAAETLGDFKLYTLPTRTTLKNEQSKQVGFLTRGPIPVKKIYETKVYLGASADRPNSVEVTIEAQNRKSDGLGLAMPAGVMRFYTNDKAGRSQFVGEDRLPHTADGEKIKAQLGKAFDVKARPILKNREVISREPSIIKFDQQVLVTNAGDKPVDVKVTVPVGSGEATVLTESAPHRKPNAQTLQWIVNVPAKGKTTLSVDVRVAYK
ncbi:MAG: hypothetical protein AAGF15_05330 [Pseudomonadota bacterium]